MLPFEDRYTRQRQLAEVGVRGQERLAAASVRVCPDGPGRVEATYLQRAGLGSVLQEADVARPEFAHADEFADPSARQFAEGAWRACRQIRRILESHVLDMERS